MLNVQVVFGDEPFDDHVMKGFRSLQTPDVGCQVLFASNFSSKMV